MVTLSAPLAPWPPILTERARNKLPYVMVPDASLRSVNFGHEQGLAPICAVIHDALHDQKRTRRPIRLGRIPRRSANATPSWQHASGAARERRCPASPSSGRLGGA